MKTKHTLLRFVFILLLTLVAGVVALPQELPIKFSAFGKNVEYTLKRPPLTFTLFGKPISFEKELKKGLDIQGGMQVVLQANMNEIEEQDKTQALEAASEKIRRRVDMYGISEPVVQTSQTKNDYRIIVELAGIDDVDQALSLIGTTAELDFRLFEATDSAEATQSALVYFSQFKPTGLTGKELKKATVDFDPTTGEPVVGLQFDNEGKGKFAEITKNNVGEQLAIFLDGFPIMQPQIQVPILDGQAIISGGFTKETAKELAIQLNAGALPVPIDVLEQRSIGASLGQTSVNKSVTAGVIGIGLVMLFMILVYGAKGVVASVGLVIYSILTVAVYKFFGVVLTLPGISGLLLSIGMAVDANILFFERMKEELRRGNTFSRSLELGFGRAWDSIKDANLATIVTALILINPLDFGFLNTSGMVRGFGITLLIGVLIGLFTGVVVTRTLMRISLPILKRISGKK